MIARFSSAVGALIVSLTVFGMRLQALEREFEILIQTSDVIDGHNIQALFDLNDGPPFVFNNLGEVLFDAQYDEERRGIFTMNRFVTRAEIFGEGFGESINDGEISTDLNDFGQVAIASDLEHFVFFDNDFVFHDGDVIGGHIVTGLSDVQINNDGVLAVRGQLPSSLSGIATTSGDFWSSRGVDYRSYLLGTHDQIALLGNFTPCCHTVISVNGNVVYSEGEVIGDLTLTDIDNLFDFNASGNVLYEHGNHTTQEALVLDDEIIAIRGDVIEGLRVRSISSASLNDLADVAFTGAFDSEAGVVSGIIVDRSVILQPGDTIAEKTVSKVGSVRFNNRRDVAVTVTLRWSPKTGPVDKV